MASQSWLVGPNLELHESVASGQLDVHTRGRIQREARERLSAHDPMLRQMAEIKVVCNQRRNFVNVLIKKEYITLCHHDTFGDVRYCYFFSDKIEPFVIITAVHPEHGRLATLTRTQFEHLCRSVDNFKSRFGIAGESYHYTSLAERQETDRFVESGAAAASTKSHSSHFHLKMRIATDMYRSQVPALQLLNLSALRASLEPVRYNWSRDCLTWERAYEAISKDCTPDVPSKRERDF